MVKTCESNSSQENDISSGKCSARAAAVRRDFTACLYKRLQCAEAIAPACDLTANVHVYSTALNSAVQFRMSLCTNDMVWLIETGPI